MFIHVQEPWECLVVIKVPLPKQGPAVSCVCKQVLVRLGLWQQRFCSNPPKGSLSEVSETFHTSHCESVPVAQGMYRISSLSDSIVKWIGDKSYIKE